MADGPAPACQTCNSGVCVAASSQDGQCCDGASGGFWCQAGSCEAVPATGTIAQCQGFCAGGVHPGVIEICGTPVQCPDCTACGCTGIACSGLGPVGNGLYCRVDGATGSCFGVDDCTANEVCCGGQRRVICLSQARDTARSWRTRNPERLRGTDGTRRFEARVRAPARLQVAGPGERTVRDARRPYGAGQGGTQAYWPASHPSAQLLPATLTHTVPTGHDGLLGEQLTHSTSSSMFTQAVVLAVVVMHTQSRPPPLQSEKSPVPVQTLASAAQVPCGSPQRLAPPAPQTSPATMQGPQSMKPPQPSLIVPQFFPWIVHVVGPQHWS